VRGSIESLGPLIIIEPHPIFSITHPQLRLTYTPTPPVLTIRRIISTIASADQSLQVKLVEEATIEERAESLTNKEQDSLRKRLIAAFIFSIPTFIFGIVFMSLLPSQSSVRQYFAQPMWAGSVTRTVWVLFFLATPVQFFIADVFHRKALQEIKTLWRPGSQNSIYSRFFKFGSMNLLVRQASRSSLTPYRCLLAHQ
jgi:P-type Cu+ transporter